MECYFNNENKYYLNIILTDEKEMKKLNKKFKNKIGDTDVLTFVNKLNHLKTSKEAYCDIFFSAETIKKDAKKNLLNFYDHITHLIIHCFLHVNGYDHKKKI